MCAGLHAFLPQPSAWKGRLRAVVHAARPVLAGAGVKDCGSEGGEGKGLRSGGRRGGGGAAGAHRVLREVRVRHPPSGRNRACVRLRGEGGRCERLLEGVVGHVCVCVFFPFFIGVGTQKKI